MSKNEALELVQKLSNDHMNGQGCDLESYSKLKAYIILKNEEVEFMCKMYESICKGK